MNQCKTDVKNGCKNTSNMYNKGTGIIMGSHHVPFRSNLAGTEPTTVPQQVQGSAAKF